MPSRRSPDTSIGRVDLSQIVKAAAVAIGSKDSTISHLSLLQLAEEVGDDSLMEIFDLCVAGKIELWENGVTPRYNDLHDQKEEAEAKISDRILEPISYLPAVSAVDKKSTRFEVSRELSALSYGIFELVNILNLSKQSSSRKPKS